MKKSLQQIENWFISQGYTDDKLRQALNENKEYQKILIEKKSKLSKRYNVSSEELKRYVLSEDLDYKILGLIKELETKNLSKEDNKLIKLIKTQLEHDWRKPLIDKLQELRKKYQI